MLEPSKMHTVYPIIEETLDCLGGATMFISFGSEEWILQGQNG